MPIKLKSDKYRKARGGYSRFLNIYCEHCGEKILVYQKDGPGILKRLYLDRIFAPHDLSELHKFPLSEIPNLSCLNCKTLLGIPYIYQKEKRKAYRLFVGAILKSVTKI